MFNPRSKAHNIIFKKRLDHSIWGFLCNQKNAHASIVILILQYMHKHGNEDVRQAILEQSIGKVASVSTSSNSTSYSVKPTMSNTAKRNYSSQGYLHKTKRNSKSSNTINLASRMHNDKTSNKKNSQGTMNKSDINILRHQLFGH